MTEVRTLRTAVLIALLSVGIAASGHELFYMPWLRTGVAHRRPVQQPSPESLDHEIRNALPTGASQVRVEAALRARHMDYGYATANEIKAIVRDLPENKSSPSGTLLLLQFHFDNEDALTRIDSRVISREIPESVVE